MYFRERVGVQGLRIILEEHEKISPSFSYRGEYSISVAFCRPSDEERRRTPEAEIVCEISSTLEPPNDIHAVFESLACNKFPSGGLDREKWPDHVTYIDNDGNIAQGRNIALEILPIPFAEYCEDISSKLYEYAQATIQMLRWRWDIAGPHNPAKVSFGTTWSLDGKCWYDLPQKIDIYGEAYQVHRINETYVEETLKLARQGYKEPLAHALLREAWGNRHESTRSAYVIGVAALEVGVKQCIGRLAPDAVWLIETGPSPSIDKILSKYLPQLTKRLDIPEKTRVIPRRILKEVQDALGRRNKLVHVGGKPPTYDAPTFEETRVLLNTVRDLLWILDYYCGFGWAINRVSLTTQSELGLIAESRASPGRVRAGRTKPNSR
jgi:hypothetical protein